MSKIRAKAVLFPFREATLSARIEGTISRYAYRAGERFRSGSILLTVDDEKFRNDYERAESQARECALNVKYTKQKLLDNRRLFKESLQSEIEVQKSEFEADVALERLKSAQSTVKEASLNLRLCRISAPFDGRVESLLTREFETVRLGQPLLSILDDNKLLAVMNLPTEYLVKIRRGMVVTVKINETGKNVSGPIYEIAAKADHRSETFEVKALIDNANHSLAAGMSGVLMEAGGL